MPSLPLAGITVVSLEQAVAAPFATRQLADNGARVIKVERDSGDFARNYDATVLGQSSYFVWLNRSKESIVLDLKAEEDLSALKRIISQADVFVQNLAPGAVERMGLSESELSEINPGLITVNISGYGSGGPMQQKKAYDLLVQCESGLLSVTGTEEQEAKVGISIADIATGMYAYTGVLTALINRFRTGRGDVIEISMLEALAEWMQQPELYARYGGSRPARSGASHASIAPYGPFKTADGKVFLAVQNDREWKNFCLAVLQSQDLLDDKRFSSNTLRVQNTEELRFLIENRFADMHNEQLLQLLDESEIANAELRDVSNFAEHPQIMKRNRWIDVHTPAGVVRQLRPPVTSKEQLFSVSKVPSIGEHTEAIRQEFNS